MPENPKGKKQPAEEKPRPRATVCPACGSTEFQHIRGKLHCAKCRAIVETCCDGLP